VVGPQRECELLALASEREKLRSRLGVFAQSLAPLVGVLEHRPVTGDLDPELESSVAAVPPVEALELPLGRCESPGRSVAELIEALLLVGEDTHRHVAAQSRLVEREPLGGGALEGAGGAFR
jgi:hypothetical protein